MASTGTRPEKETAPERLEWSVDTRVAAPLIERRRYNASNHVVETAQLPAIQISAGTFAWVKLAGGERLADRAAGDYRDQLARWLRKGGVPEEKLPQAVAVLDESIRVMGLANLEFLKGQSDAETFAEALLLQGLRTRDKLSAILGERQAELLAEKLAGEKSLLDLFDGQTAEDVLRQNAAETTSPR